MKAKQGKSTTISFLKINLWTTISMKRSRQETIDMVNDGDFLKNNQTTVFPVLTSYLQHMELPNTVGLVCNV